MAAFEDLSGAPAAPSGIDADRHSTGDALAYHLGREAFESSEVDLLDRLEAFPRFASKRSLARFLCRHELFQRVLDVNGVIVECGVFNGSGLFTWAQLSNIYEPTNYTRKIIGFDTFEGFPSTSELDNSADSTPTIGDLHGDTLESLKLSVEKYNNERHLSHIPNIELVQGDFMETAEKYVEDHKHLLVSLLYLDFDLYEPTKKALEVFLPRMGKGSI